MNAKAREAILRQFWKRRKLSVQVVPPGLADMICAASAPYFLMIECLDGLGPDPTNGLLVKLIDRAYETAAGSLALIAIGHLREAEILSRSVYESSVTTAYMAKDSPALRIAQFFRSYVRLEREQNRKWEKETQSSPLEVRHEHALRIQNKNEALDAYDQFIAIYIAHCDIDSESATVLPGLLDRLTALERRMEYRTVYAAMCSQSHHDAEDVLNYFFANSVTGADGLAERMEREADTFSIFMVLFGLQWLVEAILAVSRYLQFPTVEAEGAVSLKRITDELVAVGPLLDSGNFPASWISRRA